MPDCKSTKPQKRLSNHFTKYHPDLKTNERKTFLRNAIVAKKGRMQPELGQKKLELEEGWIKTEGPGKTGTSRSMERFPSDHEELVKFKSHLMGIAGKRRSSTSADNIAREISKMLYYGDPEKLDWVHITNKNKIKLYMEKMQKMQKMKIGPESQLTTLERLCDALEYLKYHYNNGSLSSNVADIAFHIPTWKKVLRKEKRKSSSASC